MQYDKEFEEEWKYSNNWFTHMEKEYAWEVWQASRRDMYRIGEEVQIDCRSGGQDWERGMVGAITAKIGSGFVDKAERIRRWPAWEPKEGDAVLFSAYNSKDILTAFAGVFSNGAVRSGDDTYSLVRCRPFNADKIGKPWDEI